MNTNDESGTAKQVIRIVVADDHPIVRRGLVDLMETTDDIVVVGEAANGVDAILLTERLLPDILLLDLVMPDKDGLEVIEDLQVSSPSVRILVLTSFSEKERVLLTIKGGAIGYMLKDSSPVELLQAIRDVYRGSSPLHPQIAQQVISELQHQSDHPQLTEELTTREKEITVLVSEGLSNQEIADKLWISPKTVSKHISNILLKTKMSNRTKLAVYVQKNPHIAD